MLTRTSRFALSLVPFVVLVLALFVSGAEAATFTVNQTGNAGDLTCDATCTLRDAVDDSNNLAGSDTIVFDAAVFATPQTIALASVITLNPATGDSLTIAGPGLNLLTVDGNDGVSGNVRIFTVSAGDTVSISGMTLTNGGDGAIDSAGSLTVSNVAFTNNVNGQGGAITSGGASLTISNCTFTGNTSTSGSATGLGGGALYNNAAGSTVSISNSSFTNNSDLANNAGGGAIRNRGGSMDILNSTFTGNSSVVGSNGAINNTDTMTITGSTFTGNAAPDGNGGIGNSGTLTITASLIDGNSSLSNFGGVGNSGTLSVVNSTISNNIANSDNGATGGATGGGIGSNAGSMTITGSTVTGNQALGAGIGRGGGVGITGGTATLTNSTISGNSAAQSGGATYSSGTSGVITTIESCTIVNNVSSVAGGGIVRASTTNPVNLRNSIFANNTDNGTAPNIQGTVVSQGHNLIEVTTGATITGDTTGNITGQDPNLGALANNGGPTHTHALQPLSPAVDTGDPVNFQATDQRGLTRPADGDSAGGARSDIGAFELLAVSAADVTITGRVLAANGRAISGAVVQITSAKGEPLTARTNTFGYFRFKAVEGGESYVLTVSARGYSFAPLFLSVNDDIDGLIITPTGRR